jgi:hypothetical protein
MGTGHHLGYGRFVRWWLSARCQGAFDDSQDQPQADQDDDEAEKLAHGFRKVLIYGFFCTRSREQFEEKPGESNRKFRGLRARDALLKWSG